MAVYFTAKFSEKKYIFYSVLLVYIQIITEAGVSFLTQFFKNIFYVRLKMEK